MANKFGQFLGYTGALVVSLLLPMGVAVVCGLWFKLLFLSFRLGWKFFN